MLFTNFYAGNAVCSPSRAVLLTGKKSSKSSIRGNAGFYGNDKWEGVALDKDEFTLGEMFKGAGYQTAFIGKWHLDNPDNVDTWAVGHGFDLAVQEQWMRVRLCLAHARLSPPATSGSRSASRAAQSGTCPASHPVAMPAWPLAPADKQKQHLQ